MIIADMKWTILTFTLIVHASSQWKIAGRLAMSRPLLTIIVISLTATMRVLHLTAKFF